MNKLSKRLKNIVEVVEGKRIIDVGCDHGKVVLELFLNNKIDYAICSDISLPSVNKADILLKNFNISKEKFDIRCGNGLSMLNKSDNIDTAIIAGMGGLEIVKILDSGTTVPDILILQPQRNIIEVKNFILEKNYHITYDKIIKDGGKFYNIIKAKKGSNKQDISDFEKLFGKDNFNQVSTDFIEFINYQKKKYTELIDKVNISDRQSCENMLKLIDKASQKL